MSTDLKSFLDALEEAARKSDRAWTEYGSSDGGKADAELAKARRDVEDFFENLGGDK